MMYRGTQHAKEHRQGDICFEGCFETTSEVTCGMVYPKEAEYEVGQGGADLLRSDFLGQKVHPSF